MIVMTLTVVEALMAWIFQGHTIMLSRYVGFLSKRSRVAIITRILLLYKVSEFTYSFAKVTPIIVEFNPRSPTVKL